MNARASLYAAVLATLLTGCARPLDVKVVDALNGAPIAGARVLRMDMARPYFIVGAIVPRETRVTDSAGVAHLNDRHGMALFINAGGFKDVKADIDPKAPSMTVEMTRAPVSIP